MNIAVVENEAQAAQTLISYIEKWSKDSGVPCKTQRFGNGLEFIENYKPEFDVVFMDIVMPMLDGMTAAHKLREKDEEVAIVFVTNMAQFAINGYKVHALDYLLKPITYFDLEVELNKIYKIVSAKVDKPLMFLSSGTLHRLKQSEIAYVEIVNHDIVVHIGDTTLSRRGTLKEIEEQLDMTMFSRCNNCYIVNLKFVASVDGDTIVLDGGERIIISRPRKPKFIQDLTAYYAGVVSGNR